MKMNAKKYIPVLLVVIVIAAMLVAPVSAKGENPPDVPSSALALPTELQAIVAALVGYVVTQGLKSLSNLLNKDLSGWGAAITASFVTTLIYCIGALLSAVPAEAQQSVSVLLTLIVTILGAFGVHNTIKTFSVR